MNLAASTTLPARKTVAVYRTYIEAQKAVDRLSDEKFPVEHVAIVAEGLQFIEQVTGRLHWGKAFINGALSGAITGGIVGFLFALFGLIERFVSALLILAGYGVVIGAIMGGLIGLTIYLLSGGERDFMSRSSVQAQEYNVVVDAEAASWASELLQQLA